MASDSDSDSDFEQQVTQVPRAPKLGSRRLLSPTTSEPEDNSPEPPRAPRMGSRRLVHSTSMNDLPHTSTDDDFSSSSSSDNVPPPAPRINTRSLSNRSLRSDCSSDSFVSASSHGSARDFCLSRASSTASLATGDDVFEPVSPPQAPKDSLSPDANARDADSDSLSSSLDSSAHSGALFMNIAPGGPSVLALPPSPSQAPGSSLIVNLPPHTSPSSPLHNLPLRPSSHRFSRNAFHQL